MLSNWYALPIQCYSLHFRCVLFVFVIYLVNCSSTKKDLLSVCCHYAFALNYFTWQWEFISPSMEICISDQSGEGYDVGRRMFISFRLIYLSFSTFSLKCFWMLEKTSPFIIFFFPWFVNIDYVSIRTYDKWYRLEERLILGLIELAPFQQMVFWSI